MKNFDDHRTARALQDRDFQLAGQHFVRKAGIRPEVLTPWESVNEDTPASEVLKVIDDLVIQFIEPFDDAHNRYRQIRADEDDPITLGDLQEVVEWLISEQTGRPTGQPSASTPSVSTPGTGSTDGSSSLEVAALTV